MPATLTKDDLKKADDFIVRDPSCNASVKERTHELIINGEVQPFTFKHGEDKKYPHAVAMKFLKAGFTVIDSEGKKVDPTPEQPADGKLTLRDDQTIAAFAELSRDALYKRCLQEKGGEKFTRNDRPDQMAAFLIERKKAEAQERAGPKENGAEDFTPPAEPDVA